jgi:hypothetical protein
MSRMNARGFLIAELAATISVIALLVGLVREAEPVVDRFCAVASAPAPNGGRSARMMSDFGRWVCVAIPGEEAPEDQYARLAQRTEHREGP